MDFSIIHHSWKPLMREFNTDTFLAFKNEVLPLEKYYPESKNVFRVFSMPVSDIKLVVVGSWKHPNIRSLEQQGLFWLHTSLTSGVSKDHRHYWEPFIKKVIYFIAKSNPCIWILPTTEAQAFTANLPVKSIFNVLRYTDETIQHIPINVSYNYVFKGTSINEDHINTILVKKGLSKINF